jgi:hypothetical protein
MAVPNPFGIPKYERVRSNAKYAFNELTAAQKGDMRRYRSDGSARTYGSAGVQPSRNVAFASQTGFARWKTKHPRSPYNFQEVDIDNDGIQDAVVWADSARTQPVAVNGWGNKGSKARLHMRMDYVDDDGNPTNYWDANAVHHGKYRDEYFKAPLTIKQTLKGFTKAVIKPFYDQHMPKTAENAAYRKKHPASQFARGVAQLLVGNDLDAELLQRYNAQPTPQNIRQLHSLKVWKEAFDQRLRDGTASLATDPRSGPAVRDAMDRIARVLEQADADEPRLVQID